MDLTQDLVYKTDMLLLCWSEENFIEFCI